MKKTISLFLIITLIIFSTAACSRKAESDDDKENVVSKTITEETEVKKTAVEKTDDKASDTQSNEEKPIATPCKDMQIFDLTDSKVSEAMNAYQAVLSGEADMINAYDKESISRDTLKKELTEIGFKIIQFAVLDVDDDGLPEIVLPYTRSASYDSHEFFNILYYRDGQVYSIVLSNRQLDELKTDGTFRWDGGGAYDGFATISFTEDKTEKTPYTYDRFTYRGYYESEENPETEERIWTDFEIIVDHQNVTEAEFDKACEEQDHKPNVEWYAFTDANIKYLSSGKH